MSKKIYAMVLVAMMVLTGTIHANSTTIENKNIQIFTESQDPPISAPEVVFRNGKGEKVKISDLKGKVIFINFWATWCPPCRVEMPTINKLYKQFKDNKDIVFLMVDADNNYKKSSKFVSKKGYLFPVYTSFGDIPYVYFSGALPTTVMIGKKGNIVFRHAGAADYSDPKMVTFVKELLGEDV